MAPERPKVGVGVAVIRDGQILLGKRRGAHGEGSWSFPGGHLEFGESLEDCARREVQEETGLSITNPRSWTFTNDIFPTEGKHYITCYVVADWESGEPQLLEPDRSEAWQWCDWNNLPTPLFIPLQNLLKAGKSPLNF